MAILGSMVFVFRAMVWISSYTCSWEEACGSLHLGNVEGKRLLWTLGGDPPLGSARLHPQGAGWYEHCAKVTWLLWVQPFL